MLSLAMSLGLTGQQQPPAAAPADDTTPDAFEFDAVTGAARSTLYTSNTITISGINAAAPVTVSGGQYRKNGGSWTSAPGEVVNGDVLQVRGTSSAAYVTPVNVSLNVGGVSDTFTITTAAEAPDTSPDPFSFTDVTGAERSTVYTSDIVTITGINAAAPVTIAGGEYRKNGGSWTTSAGTVVAGDTLQVRGTSSASYSADVNVTPTVGGVADTFTISTEADAGAVADVHSVTIIGATLLDATGDYGDATSRIGVNGNGWTGRVALPYRVAQNLDPSKLIHEVEDEHGVTRFIRGTEVLRRQYTAANSKQQSENGVIATMDYGLEELVYENSILISVTAEPGFYGDLAAGTVTTITNGSTRPYYKPLGGFLNTQIDRATGTSMRVEFAVADRHGRNGRMVQRVEFDAVDDHGNHAALQTVTATTPSTLQTQGNIAEVFAADIPLANLTQGDFCTVNVKAYSWVGGVLEINTFALTANPQNALGFLNDKNGTYGGAKAYVRPGAGGTGVVSRTDATARASPFATIALAFAALAAFNNANSTPAHNDHSGSTIYLMDDGAGGAVAHTIAASISTPAGDCWTDIRPDPSATGAVSLSMTATRSIPDLVRFFVDINHTAGNGFDGGSTANNKMIAFAGGTITSTGGAPLCYRNGLCFLSNVTINATGNLTMLAGFSSTRTQAALALGVIAENAASDGNVLPFVMVGCRLKRLALQEQVASTTSWDSQDGMFVYNNWFRDVRSAGTISALNNNRAYSVGLALVQNLFENSGSGQTALRLGGDNQVQACDNVLVHYNTFVGGRLNIAYADVAGAAGVIKRVDLFGNLGNDTVNIKSDTYTGSPAGTVTARGRVGNWEARYHVGHRSNVFASGSASGSAVQPDGSSWLGEWAHVSNRWNVGIGNITFADDRSTPIGSGALSGTYSLTGSTNAAYDAVAVGDARLSFDIAGLARNDNEPGAAGCYERAA